MVDQQPHGHTAAHRMADQHGPYRGGAEQCGIVEQRRDVVGEVTQTARRVDRGGVRLAVPAQIRCHDPPAGRQRADQGLPKRPG
jgi:hypothetical protein